MTSWAALQPVRAAHAADAALDLAQLGKYDAAAAKARRAAELNPLSVDPLFQLAFIADARGDTQGAKRALERRDAAAARERRGVAAARALPAVGAQRPARRGRRVPLAFYLDPASDRGPSDYLEASRALKAQGAARPDVSRPLRSGIRSVGCAREPGDGVGRHSAWHGLLIAGAIALAAAETVHAAPCRSDVRVPQSPSRRSVPPVPCRRTVPRSVSLPQLPQVSTLRCASRRRPSRPCRRSRPAVPGGDDRSPQADAHADAAARGRAALAVPVAPLRSAHAGAPAAPSVGAAASCVVAVRSRRRARADPRALAREPPSAAAAAEAARRLRRHARPAAGAGARPACGPAAASSRRRGSQVATDAAHVAHPRRPDRAARAGQPAQDGPCGGCASPASSATGRPGRSARASTLVAERRCAGARPRRRSSERAAVKASPSRSRTWSRERGEAPGATQASPPSASPRAASRTIIRSRSRSPSSRRCSAACCSCASCAATRPREPEPRLAGAGDEVSRNPGSRRWLRHGRLRTRTPRAPAPATAGCRSARAGRAGRSARRSGRARSAARRGRSCDGVVTSRRPPVRSTRRASDSSPAVSGTCSSTSEHQTRSTLASSSGIAPSGPSARSSAPGTLRRARSSARLGDLDADGVGARVLQGGDEAARAAAEVEHALPRAASREQQRAPALQGPRLRVLGQLGPHVLVVGLHAGREASGRGYRADDARLLRLSPRRRSARDRALRALPARGLREEAQRRGGEVVEGRQPRRDDDLFHAPWMDGALLHPRVPMVVTVHDLVSRSSRACTCARGCAAACASSRSARRRG